MKKNYIVFTALLALLYITLKSDVDGAAHHGHGNVTGATTGAVGHCQTSSCHGTNNARTIVQLQVLDSATMLPVTVYNALQTYLITLTGNDTAVTTVLPGFGFQASAVLGNHTQAGTFVVPTALARSIHTYPCGATTVIEHSTALLPTATGSNKYSIQFYWTAPPPASDSVTFFAMLNAVNGNGDKTGDYPNAAPHVTIYENPATATCGVPSALAGSVVSPTSEYLSWSSVAGAISYNIQYRPIDSTTWSNATSTTNSKTLAGLIPSTAYEFQVQTVCGGGRGAFTATTDTFTTPVPNSAMEMNAAINNFSIYPNPAAGDAVISYNLTAAEKVSVTVYDFMGRKVTQQADNEFQNSGSHEYRAAIDISGVYYIRITAGNSSNTLQFVRQ